MRIPAVFALLALFNVFPLKAFSDNSTQPFTSTGMAPSAIPASTGNVVSASSSPAEGHGSAASASEGMSARRLVDAGHRRYFLGEMPDAAASYQKALGRDPGSVEAWVNGGVVLEEMHRLPKAAEWYRKALDISPEDPKIRTALGWAEFHARDLAAAEADFKKSLERNPNEIYALLGLGRIELATQRANQAEYHLTQAATLAPLNNLTHFWKAQALEAEGDIPDAIEAYKRAASDDSYFVEARYALGRAYMRRNWLHEAAVQFSKVLDADPDNGHMRILLQKVEGLWNGRIYDRPLRIGPLLAPQVADVPLPVPGNTPTLRIGIGTNPMGRSLPQTSIEFRCKTAFAVLDSSEREIAKGDAGENWQVRFAWRNKAPRIEIINGNGRRVVSTPQALRIHPVIKESGILTLRNGHSGGKIEGRRLRGEVEFSLHPNRRSFKMVNIVDLESYTQGVLSAEMPIESPLEALKAQSVVARTNALYATTVLRRHRKHGYDLCDGEHCQVYTGVTAESDRSRAVVNATRGRIVAYQGKVAQVLYASNCGGHTQSGREIPGWGDVPYWEGVSDAPPGSSPQPRSPWELHWWLRTSPPAYCMPSRFVHPSHYRWTRVLAAKILEEKFNRKMRPGKLLGIRTLRRSDSGHVDSVLILGSRRNIRISDETRIRNLLGIGSIRSTLFIVDTEYGPEGLPETFVFHGAGWGHGVGMCQSGAMGRADQGQSYEDILKAYYPNTQLGSLRY